MKCKGKEALGKTSRLIETIKNAFKNSVKASTDNGVTIKEFAAAVKKLTGNETKSIELDIAPKQVSIFKKFLGINLNGFKRVFESGYIRHTYKKHGIKSNDARPVTEGDFALYEDIVTNPDRISKSVTDDGKPAVVYVKKYDDKIYVVEEVRVKTNGQHKLVFRSMFKGSLAQKDETIRNVNKRGVLNFKDVGGKASQMSDAQPNAAPTTYVPSRSQPSSPTDSIIPQSWWENQVDRFVEWLGKSYANKNNTQVNNGEMAKNFYHKIKTEPFEKLEPIIRIGQVGDSFADKIKKTFGINIKGFQRIITRDGFIHIRDKHGEGSIDPRPITEADMLRYEDIVINPDKIGHTKTPQGLDAIMYMKRYDNTIYIIEEIRTSTRRGKIPSLAPKTMFKQKLTSKELKNFEGKPVTWVDFKEEGYQAMNALADANRPSHVQNAPDTPSSNGIIQQTRWENQVDRFVEWLGKSYAKGEKAVLGKLTGGRVENALSVKQAAKDIYEITNDFRIAKEQMNAQAKEVMEFINKSIGEQDRLALFRTLNGDAARDDLPAHMISTYDKFRKLIDSNAQALVDAGVLKEKYKIDDYLKRFYKDYLDKRDGFTKAYFDNFKARKNLTEDERIALGMVQDAGFVIAQTLKEQRTQLIKANMLKTIAEKFGKDAEFEGSVFIPDSTAGGGVKRYGALAGKWVDKETADALFGSAVLKRELDELGDFTVKFGTWWTKAVDHIKINVTVKNPMTHAYNVGSNMILSFLHGDMTYLAKALNMRLTNPTKFKEWVTRANKQGLNSYLGDMEKLIDELAPDVNDPIYLAIIKNLYFSKGSKTGDLARKWYDWEDKIFKLAQFMRNIEKKGIDDKTAMKLAQESYVNYTTPLPGLVRTLDKSGLVPFLHYSYKSTPMVFKTILKHPVKFAVLQAALLGSGASAWLGDSSIENARKPKWAQNGRIANFLGINSWTQLPFADKWYLNTGRLVPGFRFDGFDLLAGGFLRGVLDITAGKSTLGYPLDKEDDDMGTKILKRTTEMAKSYLPPVTFGRYGQQSVGKITGLNPPRNIYQEEMDWDEIFLRAAGVRRFNEAKEINSKKRAAEKRYKKAIEEAKTVKERQEAKREYQFDLNLLEKASKGVDFRLDRVR